MITVWRKGKTHNRFAPDGIIEEIEVVNDEVVLTFDTSGGRGQSDFQICISSDSRKSMIEACLTALTICKPKNITDYTEDELMEALKAKMKSEMQKDIAAAKGE